MKQRLDKIMAQRGLVTTRSQAESWIRMGKVKVDGKVIDKAGFFVSEHQKIDLDAPDKYVSRAGLKLASIAAALKLDFSDKVVLDVGSSTGGFTDYALQHGARKVVAVDVGTDQLHPSLRDDSRIELHEKTDIRDFKLPDARGSKLDARESSLQSDARDSKLDARESSLQSPASSIDIVLIDVSFISLREILPTIYRLPSTNSLVVAMVKPQFEAGYGQTNKGVVKNESHRRQILKDFELWTKQLFIIVDKADSEVAGARGNRERFYLLKPIVKT